ncbi:MAG: hypothetical protein AAFX79_07465 [Planctomycetota bacterium]
MRRWHAPAPARRGEATGPAPRRFAPLRWARPDGAAAPVLASLLLHAGLLAFLALGLSGVVQVRADANRALELGTADVSDVLMLPASPPPPATPMAPPDDAESAEGDGPGSADAIDAILQELADGSAPSVAADRPLPRGDRIEPVPVLRRGLPEALGEQAAGPSAMGRASFAGVQAERARRVIYAVDASGAMVTSLPFVLDELERSVAALAPDQSFQVVLFGLRPGDAARGPGGAVGVRVFPSDGPGPATTERKLALARWLADIAASGRSNPLDGLLAALAGEPDVVFLLSRSIRRGTPQGGRGSWGRGRRAILDELERANPVRRSIFGPPGRDVQIKCVQFLEEDPTGIMRAIAEIHGGGPGSYKLLFESELRDR